MRTTNISTPLCEQRCGHIYIVDVHAFGTHYGWLLTAVLLHKKPFMEDSLPFPQSTSAVKLKIKSPSLNDQTLCIQQALIDGKRVYAEILFNDLKLIANTVPGDIPNTEGDLVAFHHIVVEYRNNACL